MHDVKSAGLLSVVATPIGNLEDITLRALNVLRSVDFVVAEDTRHTRKLLSHFDIRVRIKALHEHSSDEDVRRIVDMLLEGRHIAYVTDAGSPCVSDPGEELVKAAVDAGIRVVPIPGPSAVTTALMACGLPAAQFRFIGFLPRKKMERQRALRELSTAREALVFYEAPHRVRATFRDMLEILGNRPACAARELTKLHEEFIRDGLSGLLEGLADPVVGEWTIIVQGATSDVCPEQDPEEEPWQDELRRRIAGGQSLRDAAREVASARNLPRRRVYQAGVEMADSLACFQPLPNSLAKSQ